MINRTQKNPFVNCVNCSREHTSKNSLDGADNKELYKWPD